MKRLSLVLLFTAVISSGSNLLMAQWIQCGPDNGPVNCLASIDAKLFAGTDGGVFLSVNGADSWTHTMSELWDREVTSFTVMPPYLFAAESFGIYRSDNSGSSWLRVSTGLPSEAGAISDLAVLDSWIFAGTHGAGIYRSGNLGENWIVVNTGLPADTIASLAVINNILFAGTWGEGLFRSSNNGDNWVPVTSGLSGDTITALAAINAQLFAGTYSGEVFRSDNNGDSWIPISTGLAGNMVTSFTSLDNRVFVGTSNGVYSSTNNGAQWTAVNTGLVYREVRALHTLGGVLFIATGGGVYCSTNKGESWTDVSSGMKNAGIRTFVKDGSKFYVGTWIGIFLSNDECDSWEPFLENAAIFSIAFTSEDFYAGGWGHVFYTPRSSTNWVSLAYPDSTNRIYSLIARDNTVFVGTESGGLYQTKHYGTYIWESARVGFKNIPVNCLLLDGTILYAGTGTGVYSSINEGGDWTPLNNGLTNLDIRALTFKDTDLFAGTWEGGVFRSTDHGANWSPVNNGLTSLEILSLAVKDNNLFAGTWNGGVFFSTDNGTNWAIISEENVLDPWFKIPQVIHGLAVDDTYIYAAERRTSVWRRPLSEFLKLFVSTNSISISALDNSTATFNITSNTNWTVSSSETWLTVSNASGSGDAIITVIAQKNWTINTRNATVTVSATGLPDKTVIVTQDGSPTGINNLENSHIRIYPNPATNTLFIEGFTEYAQISIYDLLGNLIIKKQLIEDHIDISNLASGAYTIILENKFEVVKKMFVKQ